MHRRGWRRSGRGERGGVLLELALVIPFFTTLCLATLDLGLAWRADLNLANAVRTGNRVAVARGTASDADHSLLVALGSALGRIPPAQVRTIVVFRSSDPDGTVPPGCLTASARATGGSGADGCNVYTATELTTALASPANPPAGFSGTCPGSRRDRFWCPTSRDNEAGLGGTGLDYLGVYLEVEHQTATKLFGATMTIDDSSVMRIEPEAGS